jgi:hypothetical protein
MATKELPDYPRALLYAASVLAWIYQGYLAVFVLDLSRGDSVMFGLACFLAGFTTLKWSLEYASGEKL